MNQTVSFKSTKVNYQPETTMLRAFVEDADTVDIDGLNKTRPDFVLYASTSNGHEQAKTSFLIQISGALSPSRDAEILKWLEENM